MSAGTAATAEPGSTRFWSCQTHDVAALSGSIYDDVLESRYAYDSLVINHAGVRVGDVLVLRDPYLVRGYGVVEDVTATPGTKVMPRCPECRSADIKPRAVKKPTYRCRDCRHEFDQPELTSREVVRYVAHYGATWSSLGSAVPVRALVREKVYAKGDFPNAIRALDPRAAVEFLRAHADLTSALNLELLAGAGLIPGGHTEGVTRVRRGQMQFREALFQRFGSVCAVTGNQPADVLDAAHLYSYARHAEHRPDGGLLLRSDVHRLFDRLLISFDPSTWSSHVAPPLLDRYDSLRLLDDRPMAVGAEARPDPVLIADHYAAARSRWRALAASAN
jgi:hypothetical protein